MLRRHGLKRLGCDGEGPVEEDCTCNVRTSVWGEDSVKCTACWATKEGMAGASVCENREVICTCKRGTLTRRGSHLLSVAEVLHVATDVRCLRWDT